MAIVGQFAVAIRSALSFMMLLLVVAAIAVARMGAPITAGANPVSPTELRAAAADALDTALAPGGRGFGFDVLQRTTLFAKPDGPKIELHTPEDPTTITGVVDEYAVGTILSRGAVTHDAFWMDISVAGQDQPADFSAAAFFARVLERGGKLWRDDGAGWYVTDESPGVGMDPASARALADLLRSLTDAKALEPTAFDGRLLSGISGTATPDAYPGVIAADGAAFTEKAFALDCWFDPEGRLVRLEAHARNLNQETYDLVADTVVTFSYGAPGDPPDPNPTMAPEALPTSEPVAAEVKA